MVTITNEIPEMEYQTLIEARSTLKILKANLASKKLNDFLWVKEILAIIDPELLTKRMKEETDEETV